MAQAYHVRLIHNNISDIIKPCPKPFELYFWPNIMGEAKQERVMYQILDRL